MPYKIVEVSRGKYKVKKNQPGRPIYMSHKALSLAAAKKQLVALHLHGGDMGEEENPNLPKVDQYGLKEIDFRHFNPYQEYLINATPQQLQLQDLSTVPGGKIAEVGAELAGMIPEVGPLISDIAVPITNFLIGVFYHPKETIAQRLKKAGIDIYGDDIYIVNDDYPIDDPKHFEILLPNGLVTNAQYQARYIALIFYQKVLGNNAALWMNRISQQERDYLFPNDPQWTAQYEGLAQLHGHNNPYIAKAKFEV